LRVLFEYIPKSISQLALEFLLPFVICILLITFLWKVAYPKWTKRKGNIYILICLTIWLVIFFPLRSSVELLGLMAIKNELRAGKIEKYSGNIESVKYISGKLYSVEFNNIKLRMRNNDACFNFGRAVDMVGEIHMEYLVLDEVACAVKVFETTRD
jgi:hypothetical protein